MCEGSRIPERCAAPRGRGVAGKRSLVAGGSSPVPDAQADRDRLPARSGGGDGDGRRFRIKGHPGIGPGTPGRYRVASGFGEYEVQHSTCGTIGPTYKDHRVKMAGTLVEWIIHIAPDEGRREQ